MPSAEEIISCCLREWCLTLVLPNGVNKRNYLVCESQRLLKDAHGSHLRSIKCGPFSPATLCRWFDQRRLTSTRKRAQFEIECLRQRLYSNFAASLLPIPITVERSLFLQRSESLLQYIERLNTTRILSLHRQQLLLQLPLSPNSRASCAAASGNVDRDTGTSPLCPLFVDGSSAQRDPQFASGVASFAASSASTNSVQSTLQSAVDLFLTKPSAALAKHAVPAATTTRKYIHVYDYHRRVEANKLHSGKPCVYSCDSKMIRGKNFEVTVVSSYIPAEDRIFREVMGAMQLSNGTGEEHDRVKRVTFESRQLPEASLSEKDVECISSDTASPLTSRVERVNSTGKSLLDRSRTRLGKPLLLHFPCVSHITDNEWAASLTAMTGEFEDRLVFVSSVTAQHFTLVDA
jgi:hypothetical protein